MDKNEKEPTIEELKKRIDALEKRLTSMEKLKQENKDLGLNLHKAIQRSIELSKQVHKAREAFSLHTQKVAVIAIKDKEGNWQPFSGYFHLLEDQHKNSLLNVVREHYKRHFINTWADREFAIMYKGKIIEELK